MSPGACDVCDRPMVLRLHHLVTADDGAVAACCGPECARAWVRGGVVSPVPFLEREDAA